MLYDVYYQDGARTASFEQGSANAEAMHDLFVLQLEQTDDTGTRIFNVLGVRDKKLLTRTLRMVRSKPNA